MLNADINAYILRFLQYPLKRILLIIGDIDESSLQDLKRTVEKEKTPIHYVDLREALELENFYTNLQLDKISEKIIILCNPFLLHPTLDPSIYFSPIKSGRVQRHLLSKLILPAPKAKESTMKQAAAVVEQTNPPKPTVLWHQKLMTQDAVMMQMLADKVTEDEDFKKYLFQIIYSSHDDDQMQVAAANAITALNYARVSFSGMDLSGIRIPRADLTGALFQRSILFGANLSYCILINAIFTEANLINANLDNVEFGQLPSFSVNDETECSDVCYRSDGRCIVVGHYGPGNGGSIGVWDVDEKLNILNIPVSGYVSTFFSLDGSLLAYVEETELDTGRLRAMVTSDGSFFGNIKETKKKIVLHVWDIQSKQSKTFDLSDFFDSDLLACNFNNNKKLLAVSRHDKRLIIIDLKNNTTREIFKQNTQNDCCGLFDERSIFFSPNDQWLVMIGCDGVLRVWETNGFNNSYLIPILDQERYVEDSVQPHCGVFAANNDLMAVGYENGTLQIISLSQKRVLKKIKAHNSPIYCLQFSPDNKYLASCSDDATIRLWSRTDFSFVSIVAQQSNSIHIIKFHPESHIIAGLERDGGQRVQFYKVKEEISNQNTGHAHVIGDMCLSSDGKVVLTDISKKLPAKLAEVSLLASNLCFVNSNRIAAITEKSSHDRDFIYYDFSRSEIIRRKLNVKYVGSSEDHSVCWSDDLMVVVYQGHCASDKYMVIVYDVDVDKKLWEHEFDEDIDGTSDRITISRSKNKLALIIRVYKFWKSKDLVSVKVFDLTTNQCSELLMVPRGALDEYLNEDEEITNCVFSDNDAMLAVGSNSNRWQLWDLEEFDRGGYRDYFIEGSSSIQIHGFFENDTILIFSCSKGCIYFWDVEQQKLVEKLSSSIGPDSKIIFRNNRLISAGYDKAINIWSYTNNRLLLQWCSNPQLNFEGAKVRLALMDNQTQDLLKELKVCDIDSVVADPSRVDDLSALSGEENENNPQTSALAF